MRVRLTKKQFDKIVDALVQVMIEETDKIKENIDVNEDGFVDFREFRLVVKSLIKALKQSIKGFK